jgi:hypothetical protein
MIGIWFGVIKGNPTNKSKEKKTIYYMVELTPKM